MPRRLRHIFAVLIISALALSGRATADTYPSNKITLVVAFAAGGVADTLARMVGPGLDEVFQSIGSTIKAAKGKTINFGSAGVGSGSHIEAEYFFKKIAGIEATHVPFQGGAPAINATLGNQIDLLATTLGGGAAARREIHPRLQL